MEHTNEQNATVTPWGRQYEYELTLHNLKEAAKANGRQETAIASRIDLIRGVIGRGEHSVVYVGELRGSKRLIAVKYDHRDFSKHYRDITSKFDNLKRTDHNYIPKPIDFIPYKEETFILMDYTPGDSLQKRFNHVGITQGEALDWTCQILDALDYLHKGIPIPKEGGGDSKKDAPVEKIIHIIHGNIRTDNILLTPVREEDGTIKFEIRLIDFRLTDAKDGNPTGYGMFNNAWIEKADGSTERGSLTKQEFTEKAKDDIYYTGAVLFRMLTGIFPTKKMNRSKKAKILQDYSVTESVIKILCKSLDTDNPENRYQTAEEMLSAIRSLSANDFRRKQIIWSGVALFAGCLTMLALGAILLTLGNRFVSRTLYMETCAERAISEQKKANYTQALSYALAATEKRHLIDAETAPEALDALSSVLSVYDFSHGYKPLHSNANLRGIPVRILLSPDERFLVSLARNKSSNGFLFQIFDTESGEELHLFPLNGSLTDFVIRNDNLLIYADETGIKGYSLSEQTSWSPKNASAFAPVRLTLSPDGKTAAALSQDEREARTYSVSGEEMSYVLRESAIPEEKRDAMDLHLLEFDASGTRLAVSFSDGSIRVYRLDKPNEYAVLRKSSAYNHFEGGFYDAPNGDSYFFYVSSQIFSPDSHEFEQTKSECRFYNVKNLDSAQDNTDGIADYKLQMPRDEIMCALADKSGMYFSVKDEIYHILPQRGERGTWGPYLETNGDVLFFRHDSKSERLLAVTDNQIVVLYEENGEVITRAIENSLIGGVSFYDASLSKNYLALAGQNKISVLRWTNDSAAQCVTYPSGDLHTAARVHLDENGVPASVMLFHESGFRIYLPDGELVKETSFDNWERILSIQYERTQDRSDVDRLKVTYEDETQYYSAQDGSLITEALPSAKSSQDDAAMFQTENFRVEYSHGQDSEIYHKNKLIKELSEQPIYVSEYQGQLLISVLNANGERHSLLLNKHGKQLADFSGDCEIIPDGTLFADTQQGYILRERLLSLDELRRKAQDRRRETE